MTQSHLQHGVMAAEESNWKHSLRGDDMRKESPLPKGRGPLDHTKCQADLARAIEALAASEAASKTASLNSAFENSRLRSDLERVHVELEAEKEKVVNLRRRLEIAEDAL